MEMDERQPGRESASGCYIFLRLEQKAFESAANGSVIFPGGLT